MIARLFASLRTLEKKVAAARRAALSGYSFLGGTVGSESRPYLVALLLFFVSSTAFAQTGTNADLWIAGPIEYPRTVPAAAVESNLFSSLHAEVVAGKFKVVWPASSADGVATLFVSADKPGHWKARDWFRRELSAKGTLWETAVPVENLDVPLVYFVELQRGKTRILSPARVADPRELGLENPTSFYWNFLDGFEEGLESWRLTDERDFPTGLQLSPTAKNGRHSLSLDIPEKKRSVTAGTTRVRGWHFQQASGVRLWMRTRSGRGRARFTLMTNAFSTNQVVAVAAEEKEISSEWQMIDLPLSAFPKIPEAEIDYFTIEAIAEGPREFLVDDLQLLVSGSSEL